MAAVAATLRAFDEEGSRSFARGAGDQRSSTLVFSLEGACTSWCYQQVTFPMSV